MSTIHMKRCGPRARRAVKSYRESIIAAERLFNARKEERLKYGGNLDDYTQGFIFRIGFLCGWNSAKKQTRAISARAKRRARR